MRDIQQIFLSKFQVDDIWSELELKCQPDLSDTLSEGTGSIDATVLPMTPHGPED